MISLVIKTLKYLYFSLFHLIIDSILSIYNTFEDYLIQSTPKNMGKDGLNIMLIDLNKSSAIAAIEGNLFEYFPLFDQWSQAEVHDTSELLWSLTDIPFPLFNSVMRANLLPDAMNDAIDAAISRCRSNNVPMLWWTGPSTQPTDLGTQLSAHGFLCSNVPGMAADLNSLPENLNLPEDLVIKRVENDEDLEIWCNILCAAFGMPDFVGTAFFNFSRSIGFDPQSPYSNYLGLIKDEVVSTASLLLGAGVAGIYNVATLESARKKGVGTAMTLASLLHARSLGYRVGVLHSSDMGFKLYSDLGFQEYCKISQYVWFDN